MSKFGDIGDKVKIVSGYIGRSLVGEKGVITDVANFHTCLTIKLNSGMIIKDPILKQVEYVIITEKHIPLIIDDEIPEDIGIIFNPDEEIMLIDDGYLVWSSHPHTFVAANFVSMLDTQVESFNAFMLMKKLLVDSAALIDPFGNKHYGKSLVLFLATCSSPHLQQDLLIPGSGVHQQALDTRPLF